MARRSRLALAGELHLVQLRGHSGRTVFADDGDRGAFLAFLREAARRSDVAVHAYALLDDGVCLLATPREAAGLGRLMQSLGRSYGAAFNRRHGRSGTLWEGRFRSCIVDADALLLAAMVYVESRPVSAGLVHAAVDWTWSSAAHHIGRRRDPLLVDHPRYWQLGNTPFERERAHTVALEQSGEVAEDDRFGEGLRRALILGEPRFRERVSAALDRPLHARPRGRPRRTGA